MLFFTYDSEITPEAVKSLERQLSERTGEECVVLGFGCTGVYRFPDAKEPGQKQKITERSV